MVTMLVFYLTSLLLLLLLQVPATRTELRRQLKCRIKCGVVEEEEAELDPRRSMLSLVSSAWQELRFRKGITDIEMQFFPIRKRTEVTMDVLIEAYMEIGTMNISAMVGPNVAPLATATEKFGIPYFITGPLHSTQYTPYNVISVFPNPMDVVYVAVELAQKYQWDKAAVLYDSQEGAHLVERLVLVPSLHVRAWKLHENSPVSKIRQALLLIRRLGVYNTVLITQRTLAIRTLEEALHLSMLSSQWSWVLPNLNLEVDDLEPYVYTQVNFTTFKLVQETFMPLHDRATAFSQYEHATVYDSLLTLYRGLKIYHKNRHRCKWTGREQLYHILPKIEDVGATGSLNFREDGTRRGYCVDILALGEDGLYKIGYWNSSESAVDRSLHINDTRPSIPAPVRNPLGKDLVRVVTVEEKPFVQLKENHHYWKGNDRFEGYCVDLLNAIADMLGFKYELYLAADGHYGSQNEDGSWNGIIGELMNGNASLAVASLTITSQRESVIDFTKPFKTLGISIVMKKPEQELTLFQFTQPLSPMTWLLLLGVFILVSLTLYIIDKVAPSEDERVRYTADESVWFTIASMGLRGVEMTPRTVSGRLLAGALWFFSLIMVASYTANLAAFLTVSKIQAPIQSVGDLVGQTKVRYGTVENSQVSAFFENSKLHHFQRMWQIMSTVEPYSMVSNSERGLHKVRESSGDYAFIWDSPVIKHTVSQDCSLMEVGQAFDSRGYGIGVPMGAPYRDALSMAILKLGESGQLHEISSRWWNKGECGTSSVPVGNTQALDMQKVAGVFIILGAGIFMALVAGVFEYFCRVRRRKKNKNRKIPEKSMSAKPLCDGNTVATNVQADEPFMSPVRNFNASSSKQTNIF